MSGNGDHPSQYPPTRDEFPTMPDLGETPTAEELAKSYGTMAAAYHEVCRQLLAELKIIRAEVSLIRTRQEQ